MKGLFHQRVLQDFQNKLMHNRNDLLPKQIQRIMIAEISGLSSRTVDNKIIEPGLLLLGQLSKLQAEALVMEVAEWRGDAAFLNTNQANRNIL